MRTHAPEFAMTYNGQVLIPSESLRLLALGKERPQDGNVNSAAPGTYPHVIVEGRDYLDLTVDSSVSLDLTISPQTYENDLLLAIDVYAAGNPTHPAGHVGWWCRELDRTGKVRAAVSREGGRITAAFLDTDQPGKSWSNEQFGGCDEEVLEVHIALKDIRKQATVFDDCLQLYLREAALRRALEDRRRIEDRPVDESWAVPGFCWPRGARVHIVAQEIRPGDAIGNFALDLFHLLKANRIPARLYAERFETNWRGAIRPIGELLSGASASDLIFFHFSHHHPFLEALAALPCRKLCYYHNTTPAHFYRIYDGRSATAPSQLSCLERFHGFLTNSVQTVRELEGLLDRQAAAVEELREDKSRAEDRKADAVRGNVSGRCQCDDKSRLEDRKASPAAPAPAPLKFLVCPPVLGVRAWDQIVAEEVNLPSASTLLLSVGRLAPHKKPQDLIALFQEYHKIDPNSALVLVGSCPFPSFEAYLRHIVEELPAEVAERIRFLEKVPTGQLKTIYQRSSVFVSMSEHEGFCVPLVEAMHFGKPIFAYANDAVRETLAHTGLVFFRKDHAAIAEEIHELLADDRRRNRLVSCQRQRFEEIAAQADGRLIWQAMETAMFPRKPIP
jgi:glycosyltransferase involved in cell wall biosynthesis